MDLHTIDMDRAEARKLYLEYRAAVRDRQDAEMAEIMRGYKALAQGHQVIDIVATIKGGGTVVGPRRWEATKPLLPALAVMRADQPWCYVETSRDGSVRFTNGHVRDIAHNARRNVVRLPAGTLAGPVGQVLVNTELRYSSDHRAMVPPVPPRFLPRRGLGGYHVLWEAEWEPAAPVDPALLKHIGGDLYAVLATWDLTELERTVLARRFR